MRFQNSENILGYRISLLSIENCVQQIFDWINSDDQTKYFVCANPHSLVKAESDAVFKKAIRGADLVTPDGVGMVIASRILGGNIRSRITGSDVFEKLTEALNNSRKYSVFFLGSTEKNLAAIEKKMAFEYPNIKIAGTYSPPFKQEFSEADNRLMVDAVNQARPDVLWIGMTAPKQEKWIYQNKQLLDVKFIGAVGAVFDFYIGKVRRSKAFFLKTGLEWLPRLLQEPRRLWHRNFISAPKFLLMVFKARLSTL